MSKYAKAMKNFLNFMQKQSKIRVKKLYKVPKSQDIVVKPDISK